MKVSCSPDESCVFLLIKILSIQFTQTMSRSLLKDTASWDVSSDTRPKKKPKKNQNHKAKEIEKFKVKKIAANDVKNQRQLK